MGNNVSDTSSVPPPVEPGGSLPLTGGPELTLIAIGVAALLAIGALLRRRTEES